MRHPESAEVLVSKGARLNASQVQMLNASVTDPRAKAIIQRTAGKQIWARCATSRRLTGGRPPADRGDSPVALATGATWRFAAF